MANFINRKLELPYFPPTDFLVSVKSKRCREYQVLAYVPNPPLLPRFTDQTLAPAYTAWWNVADDERKDLVVDRANQRLRSALNRASYRLRVRVSWNRSALYCYYNDSSLIRDLQRRQDSGFSQYFEYGDGNLAYVSFQPHKSPTDTELAAYGDHRMTTTLRWMQFLDVADSLCFKTYPYLLGREVIKEYTLDQRAYGV